MPRKVKKQFDFKKYQKDCLYNFQCNFVRGKDDDIIEFLNGLDESKIDFMRRTLREKVIK